MDPTNLDTASFRHACAAGGPALDRWLRDFDRRHGDALRRDAAQALRDADAARDVVQDGMIKAWQQHASFAGDAAPPTWIRRVVRNTLIDALRARRRETPMLGADDEPTPEVQRAVAQLSIARRDTPHDAAEANELDRLFARCWAAFEHAAPDHAKALRWVAEEGLTNLEVARRLQRSPGATREYLSQCRKRARPFLEPWHRLVVPHAVRRSPPPSRDLEPA